jgi:flagellar export protein FliJ
MSRRSRLARLAAHRARAVDAATLALERATRAVDTVCDEIGRVARLVVDSRVARSSHTAGELAQNDAYIRSLAQRVAHLEARLETARAEENRRRVLLTDARVELRKLEVLDEQLARAESAAEEHALRRATDDRVGAISALRSRDD